MAPQLESGTPLADVQAQTDERNVTIDKVGVSNIRYPVLVRDRANETQHTIATVNLFVELPHQFKGTHMSRFLEVLNRHGELSSAHLEPLLDDMLQRLEAEVAHLDIEFPYFMSKQAPVTGATGLMEFMCGFEATKGAKGMERLYRLSVPVTTLCPCSKEISERGAHNQRGIVSLEVRTEGFVWFEELIESIEACASCALYPVLKRLDEKWVTEKAYDNPRFVEDLLREVALVMQADQRVRYYKIAVENQESIHAHNAYASIERWKS